MSAGVSLLWSSGRTPVMRASVLSKYAMSGPSLFSSRRVRGSAMSSSWFWMAWTRRTSSAGLVPERIVSIRSRVCEQW